MYDTAKDRMSDLEFRTYETKDAGKEIGKRR